MGRAFLVVMDSVGIGGAPDAGSFFNGELPDTGANTLGHIAQACAAGRAEEGRSGALKLPHLARLGLGAAIKAASGLEIEAFNVPLEGTWAAATEVSKGKDTPSGHWELAGLPVPWEWKFFERTEGSFDAELIAHVCAAAGIEGILGNCHAPGTAIIEGLGAEHMRSGWPICYTSADSVFQIAAHEEIFGLERLLKLCADIAPTLHAQKVGRVIARPFVGSADAGFVRTPNRRDFAIMPPRPVLSNWVQAAGRATFAVGKIGDIFSMQGFDEVRKGTDAVLMDHLGDLVRDAPEGSLTFANFVEFDSVFGHRRDVSGYACALEWFDAEIGAVIAQMREGDIMVLTADHGNDPTWAGTDHTRERVPVLVAGLGTGMLGAEGHIGFADVAAFVAGHLGVEVPR
ncbi:phosphopentomutase [Sulfitobacter guttiformis]|uniref:Phosphopentomutase n=1 Tax=Sulfitobacter guttiformis TaxID=74349 RepID=A0A420DPZ1_9RHOB|nr:phosphopentomutase [Sulfitobacter guttiformis]KIN73646.1 Phosphopentomutase [Sulfitobacter guttiformis KCTC 32187]RKE96292.1 phosphopentomutase [Sulfitobacter guttiformis]